MRRPLTLAKLGVAAINLSAIRCYERCGFITYGTEPRAVYYDGKYYDEYLMYCLLTICSRIRLRSILPLAPGQFLLYSVSGGFSLRLKVSGSRKYFHRESNSQSLGLLLVLMLIVEAFHLPVGKAIVIGLMSLIIAFLTMEVN
jgi:hypothetical protein